MRFSSALLLALLALLTLLAVAVSGQRSSSCTYWCKTRTNRFYCCDDNPGHRGRCPPVRPSCPFSARGSSPPQPCKGDVACGRADKCCYDACLELRVCKPAQ